MATLLKQFKHFAMAASSNLMAEELIEGASDKGGLAQGVACAAGIEKNKQDVVGVVHVGEATLLKRVKEFAMTANSNLTAEDFEQQVVQLEEQQKKSGQQLALSGTGPAENSAAAQVGCEHASEYGCCAPLPLHQCIPSAFSASSWPAI